jgi:hypothetical protein
VSADIHSARKTQRERAAGRQGAAVDLTPNLTDAFLTSTARAAGLSRWETEDPARHARIARSLYLPTSTRNDLAERCRALRLLLPSDAVFSHYTAARLYGVTVPDEPLIHICTQQPIEPRISGVVGHRIAQFGPPTSWTGLPLTSPARTYLDLASRLDLLGLVIAGDGLALRCDDGVEEVARTVALGRGRRGVVLARRGLRFLDPASKSAAESRLRFLLMSAGFPKPRSNEPIYDECGELLAEPDLQYDWLWICHEYESERHRERRQWELDMKRDENLINRGWILIKVNATDLFQRPATIIERTRDAFARRGVRIRH